MKQGRLQFRHYEGVFETREKAYKYLADIVNSAYGEENRLNESLMGEPIVVVYKDANDKPQAIVCIGVEGEKGDGTLKPYHIIDSAKLEEEISSMSGSTGDIEQELRDEIARAIAAEQALQSELDATQTGAGLESDGSYEPESTATYISDASSLKDADTKLDGELARVEKARKDVTGQDTDVYVPNESITSRPIAYIADATSLNDADVKLDEALQELANKTIENVVVDGVSGVVQDNLAVVSISADTIPVGPYEEYAGRANTPHPIHDDYTTLEAIKQVDTNLMEFSNNLNNGLNNEIGRATLAEQSISGIVDTFSAATVSFSAATVNEVARLDGRIDSTNSNVSDLSATTASFSAATVGEVARLDTKIEAETSRAETAENSISANVTTLSSATEAFSAATMAEIARVDATATRNKVKSTGNTIVVTEATEGTNLEANIDGKTILSNNGELKTGLKVAPLAPGELDANVREAFRLVDNEGTPVDSTVVKIYKSSSLVSVELINVGGVDNVRITYIDNSGNTQTMDLNIQQLIFEAEFKDGLDVNGSGEVRVKIDAASESFLTVSPDGVKLSGIQNAIDAVVAVETARATAAENSISGDVTSLSSTTATFSANTVAEVARLDGKIDDSNDDLAELSSATIIFSSATVAEIARLDGKIDDETARATAAENSISGDVKTLSAATEAFSAGTVSHFELMEDAWNVPGSIKHTLEDTFIKSVAVGSAEDANKSLMRYYNDGDEHKYYVSSNASDMYYDGQVLSTALNNMQNDIAQSSGATDAFSAATMAEIARLDSKIDDESTRATAAENSLSGAVDTLSASTESEIERLEDKLSDNERVVAEAYNQLKAELDRAEEGSGLNGDGTYTPHNTVGDMGNYIANANSLDEADMLLDSAIKEEETRATNAENALSGAVDTISAATDSMVADLQNQLDAANATITALTTELQTLSATVQTIEAQLDANIYAAVKAMLQGTSREIKVTADDTNETLTIGFADDAVFGPINLGN